MNSVSQNRIMPVENIVGTEFSLYAHAKYSVSLYLSVLYESVNY